MNQADKRMDDFYSTKWPAMELPREFTRRDRAKKVCKALAYIIVIGVVIGLMILAALDDGKL